MLLLSAHPYLSNACVHIHVTRLIKIAWLEISNRLIGTTNVTSVMIAVTFRSIDGEMHDCSVQKSVSLRDLQEHLCSIYRARFLVMQANLEVDGITSPHLMNWLDPPM
jgi:hypothetical protein